MTSWGSYQRDSPYRVETYCGSACHKTTTHYLNELHTSLDRDCYECVGCKHLVFVKVPNAPRLRVVLPD